MKKKLPTKPAPIPFTKPAFEKMQVDFDRLTEERKQILVRLQTAREMGDLSENGAYKYAKFELGNVSRELRRLGHLLRYGIVKENSHSDKVDFGSIVTLKNEKTEITFMLVSEHESDPSKQKLSTNSPYGQAVVGKSVGDLITVEAPAGKLFFTLTNLT